jgi:hypothetical protein
MMDSQENEVFDQHPLPATPMREALKAIVETVLPLSPGQFGDRLIQTKWGQDIDPQTAQLVTLDYNYHGHPAQNGIQQGQVASGQSLTHVLLANYQTVGDGRFGETVFGLYTPPDIGPQVRVVDKVDEFAYEGSGNHESYEGIYRRTDPQTYGPLTQIALRPADFKKWVWALGFKDQYRDYVHQAWPSDEVIVAPAAYALRTSVKAAFVMTAFLQRQENSLTQGALEVALRAAGLAPDQQWKHLSVEQLRTSTRNPRLLEISRLVLYRYTARDIWSIRPDSSSRILLYIPGNSSPLHEFADARTLRDWIVEQGKDSDKKQALAAHFAEDDRHDGTFHGGVLTALEGMATWPRQHHLKKGAGFFNDDGYWDPADYIHFEVAPCGTDLFAQLVLSMKQAAQASIETIRDDAQVNRDNLSAVVEPVVQWVNKFGPLALFVPGGEGLLALAGLIDAGYGLDQALNGQQPNDRSAGVTRTVFGLLNALPLVGAALQGEGTAEALTEEVTRPEVPLLKDDLPRDFVPAPPVSSGPRPRLELLRGIGPAVASFSDEVLAQIGKVSTVDDDMLRLMQVGHPPTPLLADTISRFRIDQELQHITVGQTTTRAELFQARYEALQYSEHQWVRLFQRQYPGLPKGAIEQVLDRSGVDIQSAPTLVETRRLFSQLNGKASQYQQHVRLNRAYEGLYLQSMENPETDILVLHSLKALPGWPRAVRLEVREGSDGGRILDHIGPIDAPDCRRLIKTGNRYRGFDPQGHVRHDTNDIYHAVLDTLPEAERSALQLQPLDAVRDLKLKISERALSRSELISGFHRMDSGLSFDAQGLRGGGYPSTSQGDALSRDIGMLQLKSIYPEFTTSQADEFFQRLGAGLLEELRQLQINLTQLNLDLSGWINQVVPEVGDMEVEFLVAGEEAAQGMDAAQIEEENLERIETAVHYEREARIELARELMSFWQKRAHESSRVYEGEQLLGFKLELDFEEFHRLPTLSAKFTDVVELSMKHFQLTRPEGLNDFLECFPNLRTLNMEGVDLRLLNGQGVWQGTLPQAIPHMLHLTTLNLKSTSLVLTERAAGQLSDLVRLQVVDLSDNPLGDPPLIQGMTELRKLNLSATGITRCPLGIPDQPQLDLLDLTNNQITRIPASVLTQAVDRDHVQLWGNPLTDEDSLRRIIAHREQTGINLWLSAPAADSSQPAVWLRRLAKKHVILKRLMWQRLEARPRGVRFLRTFEGLSRTADYQVNYPVLQARVWQLLSEADASDELWGRLSKDVGLSALDADNPFVSLMRLESRARLYRNWVQMGRPIPIDDLHQD